LKDFVLLLVVFVNVEGGIVVIGMYDGVVEGVVYYLN